MCSCCSPVFTSFTCVDLVHMYSLCSHVFTLFTCVHHVGSAQGRHHRQQYFGTQFLTPFHSSNVPLTEGAAGHVQITRTRHGDHRSVVEGYRARGGEGSDTNKTDTIVGYTSATPWGGGGALIRRRWIKQLSTAGVLGERGGGGGARQTKQLGK